MKPLRESLFDKDLIKRKTTIELLSKVLKKFFGDKVAVCKCKDPHTEWYMINPLTTIINYSTSLFNKIINYCKTIDGLEVKPDKLSGWGVKGYRIGDDVYWIYINIMQRVGKSIHVSKEFYECGALPQDQKGIDLKTWW